jgi:outer membrane biosynthesis protein TonB
MVTVAPPGVRHRRRRRARVRYPAQARELELAGQVVVRATMGMRTVRATAPFPPPPADLGQTLQVDLPLNYALE